MKRSTLRRRHLAVVSSAAVLTLSLTACGADDGSGTAGETQPAPPSSSSTSASSEAAAPRVAVSYEGGVLVLDGQTLEVVGDLESEKFTRLNPAGDGRHVMVTVADGFQLLDTGAGTDAEAVMTDTVFEAELPGHVVSHADMTVLYADGTSDTTILETADLASPEPTRSVRTVPGTEAHHGVSVVLEDGTFLTTVGDEDARTGAAARDESGTVVAENDECPGIHGEGTAAGEVVVFGCEDGALLFDDGEFRKLQAPDQPYGRMGNAFVSETSPLVVGDYKNDQDAEGYLLQALTVIDTVAGELDVVDLPEGVEYTFRDVARGPGDLAYVLATDGSIHVLDPATRELTDAFPVIDAWEGPAEWQDPHPSIKVLGDTAWVTEPANRTVHAVDLATGTVLGSATLDVEPNEIAIAG